MNNKLKLFNKKASMQLSINMIVILIMAVVVLGLGLGFINGMFAKMGDSFESKAGDEPSPTVASVSNPITVSRSNIIARPGDTEVIKVSVFSTTDLTVAAANGGVTLSCTPSGDVSITAGIGVITAANTPKEFMVPITIADGANAGMRVCTIKIGTVANPVLIASTDLSIEIKV